MRCLYCDGKLPLYRKITHGQFCSTAHRKAYWQEQGRLAVERLHETHNSLKAHRPSSVESILGRDPGETELGGFAASVLYPQSQGAPRMLVADPLAYDLERFPGMLEWTLPEHPVRSVASGGPIRLLREWSSRAAADSGLTVWRSIQPVPKMVSLHAMRPSLRLSPLGWTELNLNQPDLAQPDLIKPDLIEHAALPPSAGRVAMELRPIAASPRPGPQQFPSRTPRPTQQLDLPLAPATPEIERGLETGLGASVEMQPPAAKGLFSLTRIFQEIAIPSFLQSEPRQTLAAELATEPVAAQSVVFPGLGKAEEAILAPHMAPAMSLAKGLGTPALLPVAFVAGSVSAQASPVPPPEFADRLIVKTVGLAGVAGALPLPGPATLKSQSMPPADFSAGSPGILASPLPSPAFADRPVVKAVGLAGIAGSLRLPVPPVSTAALDSQPVSPQDLGAGNVHALASSATPEPLQAALTLSGPRFSLAMGKGSRYPIQLATNGVAGQDGDPIDFPGLTAGVPPLPPMELATLPAVEVPAQEYVAPELGGLVSLNVKFGAPPTKKVAPLLSNVATIPQPLRVEPILPVSGLQPLDAKPVSDLMQPEVIGKQPGVPAAKAHPWTRAAGFWKLAPRDLKILAFAIPALLALAFHRELPKVQLAATPPSTGELTKNLKNVMNTQWTNARQAVMDRAAVALNEDFRSGLDDWASRSDATADWSFDATGFVRPGPLALYRPSMNLVNYQVQFLGLIDKKALSWVVRAADFDNYYVLKLVVLKPGPRTTVGLTRYAVIHGKAVDRVDTVVPMEAQPDTLYRVNLQLDGDDFSLGIQGQMIDSWTEPRLPRGGIGFFTSRGEESRIRWVALTHQYDMLGRLCAYLAPYEIPTTNGSW
jgi:hypothetical protein